MPTKEYTPEEKSGIVEEYRTAVDGGGGGGKTVAEKYGIHAATILGWARTGAKASAPRRGRPPKAEPVATNGHGAVPPAAPASNFRVACEGMASYHEERAAHYRKLLEGDL